MLDNLIGNSPAGPQPVMETLLINCLDQLNEEDYCSLQPGAPFTNMD